VPQPRRLLGGDVDKRLGDGVPPYFGWPEAHDNDGERWRSCCCRDSMMVCGQLPTEVRAA